MATEEFAKYIPRILHSVCRAASKVDSKYFKIKTTYSIDEIVRERVFCYELYHQIRLILGDDFPLMLHGEIDKRGHSDFDLHDRKNPDFIFHSPGTHEGNSVVAEVKGKLSDEIRKDFEKIFLFVSRYNFSAGVFLLYNHGIEDLISEFEDMIAYFAHRREADKVFIITVSRPGSIDYFHAISQLR